MKIRDRVYGMHEITSPVIIEIIKSEPAQRAKKINVAGAWQYINLNADVSRLEHCIGTSIIVKILGGSEKEQLAALIHDLSHTTLSHVVDYLYNNKNHDFHEKHKKDIILNSEIPGTLRKYGFDVDEIMDDKRFQLLEKPIPDICADRIDYMFRDSIAFFNKPPLAEKILAALEVFENEIIFKSEYEAKLFAHYYLLWDRNICSNPRGMACFDLMAQAIRKGMDINILSEKDLFTYDEFIYNKLKQSDDPEIVKIINTLNPSFEVRVVPEGKVVHHPKNYNIYTKDKGRWVDPKVHTKEGIKRLSEIDTGYLMKMENHKNTVSQKKYIKIL